MKKLFTVNLFVLLIVGLTFIYPPISNAEISDTWAKLTVTTPSNTNCDGTVLTDFDHYEYCIGRTQDVMYNTCFSSISDTFTYTELTAETEYYVSVNVVDTSDNSSMTCNITPLLDGELPTNVKKFTTLRDQSIPAKPGCKL